MRLVSVHGDGRLHRVWTSVHRTPDPWAFFVPPSTPVQEADGTAWSSPYPVVALFWPGEYYQVFLLLKSGGTDYYCNIIAPVEYDSESRTVRFVDLDLDILVLGGRVQVADKDEFAERQASYPEAWVNGALRAKAELERWAQQGCGPFSPATADWWRVYAARWSRAGP